MTDNAEISILNNLILTSEDGAKGFKEAAKIAENPRLKLVFNDCALECHDARLELRSRVKALGGEPKDRSSIVGATLRFWAKVRAAITHSDIALLEEVERGEKRAKTAYDKALNAPLRPDVRAMVQSQRNGAARNYDRIIYLYYELKAASH